MCTMQRKGKEAGTSREGSEPQDGGGPVGKKQKKGKVGLCVSMCLCVVAYAGTVHKSLQFLERRMPCNCSV